MLRLNQIDSLMKAIKRRSDCPISYGLDFFGDKWTLLIIRDLALHKKHTFGEFLQSPEGMATNILTDRLRLLEQEGFIAKYPVSGKARIGYCLTERGISLIPLVIELAIWGSVQSGTVVKPDLALAIQKNKTGVVEGLMSQHRTFYHAHQSSLLTATATKA